MSTLSNHPTQLWISDSITLHQEILQALQEKFCSQKRCQTCITCQQVLAKEHPWIIWLTPDRSYSLEQIDDVITQASFQLDEHEVRIFVFPQAERLTEQCSNRLLKTIEEPFPGYYFLFLTSRPETLPATVRSRCIVQKFKTQSQLESYKDFVYPFLHLQFHDPVHFIKQLETLDIKEQETKEIVDELFYYWTEKTKQLLTSQTSFQAAMNICKILEQAMLTQLMPGSAKIFWKNLYMLMHYATKSTNHNR